MTDVFQDRITRCIETFLETAMEEIQAADRIVICHEGGFGHQFHGPDLIRRLHIHERCLFILLTWPGRHNPTIPLIWSGIRILHMPALPPALEPECIQRANANSVEWAMTLSRLIHAGIHRHFNKPTVNYEGFLHYAACSYPIPHYRTVDGTQQPNWILAYYKLVANVPMPKRRLPSILRERIGTYLNDHFGGCENIATLYLRQKGGGIDSSSRSGSKPIEYLPSIQILNRKGYQVFIVGDVLFTCHGAFHVDQVAASIVENDVFDSIFSDMAELDHINFKNEWIFYNNNRKLLIRRLIELFLTTECQIFIGEAGGASHLSPYDGIPTIILNVLPYAVALPNATHLYKIVEDHQGRLLPYQSLFSQHRWACQFPNAHVRENNAYEIADAVATFVNTLQQHPFGIRGNQFIGGTEDLWMLHCDGVVSPAFFRIYERSTVAI